MLYKEVGLMVDHHAASLCARACVLACVYVCVCSVVWYILVCMGVVWEGWVHTWYWVVIAGGLTAVCCKD